MGILRSALALPLLISGAAFLHPHPAHAFDCDFYQECCLTLVEAYREAGVRGMDLDNFERTCSLHHVFDAMPGAQMLFCIDAWEAMSREAYTHYLQGRIGFYPEMCMADPHYDPDEILEPDPSIPEPDPAEEFPDWEDLPPEPEPDMDFSGEEPDMDFSE